MPTHDFQRAQDGQTTEGLGEEKSAPTGQPSSFGMKLVGASFNPSKDPNVDKAKALCAQLADLVNNHFHESENSDLSKMLYTHTVGEILNCQMNVVKLLTLKY